MSTYIMSYERTTCVNPPTSSGEAPLFYRTRKLSRRYTCSVVISQNFTKIVEFIPPRPDPLRLNKKELKAYQAFRDENIAELELLYPDLIEELR